MHRCLQLAELGAGSVAPNPMVGAVIIHNDRIIGEGYHQQYGQAHAEVNCISAVMRVDKHLVKDATLYISLEPCAHFGKTPPCADLILKHGIKKVVVGCRDPFAEVNGKGIEKLQSAGVDVQVGVLEEQCKELNKRFFTFHTACRPYIILKWAQTHDGKIASLHQAHGTKRLRISNALSNRIVHKWRSEEMAILVGTNTALADDPELTTRLWPGKNPTRLVIDMDLQLPRTLKIFNESAPTIVFNLQQHTLPAGKFDFAALKNRGVMYYQVTEDVNLVHQISNALYQLNIQSALIEGGAFLLQSFIDEGMWDEARVITNQELVVGEGLPAPVLKDQQLSASEFLGSDIINYYKRLGS